MMEHEYSLDRSSRKYTCPECKQKRFVLYINNSTRTPLHSTVGRCDREIDCRYEKTPREYFADNRTLFDTEKPYKPPPPPPKPQLPDVNIDWKNVESKLNNHDKNVFIQWLSGKVGKEAAYEAATRYFVGTSKIYGYSPIFWQIDLKGKHRTGKIMQYDKNGRRRKDIPEQEAIKWIHVLLGQTKDKYKLNQCLTGEHLLIDTSKPVAVVEAPKTAIVASIYLPDFIWVACDTANGLGGEKSGLSEKCNVLKGRDVVLYPDCKAFEFWSKKAVQLSEICNSVSVSSLIEQNATEHEREKGFDIADYLIRFSPSDFVKQQPYVVKPDTPPIATVAVTEPQTPPSNPIVAAMCARQPALLRLMQIFDCEVVSVDKWEPQPLRMLTSDELTRLAAGLPDYNSWSEAELCKMLNIEPKQVRSLTDRKQIYFIERTGKYCRSGCTPF